MACFVLPGIEDRSQVGVMGRSYRPAQRELAGGVKPGWRELTMQAQDRQGRLGVQVVAIDPSAVFRKALRMWLPRTAVSVDLFHLTMLANDMLTAVRQGLSQQVRGRRRRATDPVWANGMLLLKADGNLSERGRHRLAGVFASDDPTGSLQAVWQV